MPNKLNDIQIAELVYKHSTGTSVSALAKEHELSRTTITRYLKENAELEQKCADKKVETITEWIKSNSSELTGLLDDITSNLKGKLKDASVRELFGGLKILTDLGINLKGNKPQGDDKQDEITIEFVDNSGGDSEE